MDMTGYCMDKIIGYLNVIDRYVHWIAVEIRGYYLDNIVRYKNGYLIWIYIVENHGCAWI